MSYITKYRPTKFNEVIGHVDVIKSLEFAIENGTGHALLFTGPTGIGKTTLARIVASELGCQTPIEIDGATNTGIDKMRELTGTLMYKAIGDRPIKVVILDECHAISSNAWASLLKSLEEPPEHVFWILCTTEASKVPKTIKTRCMSFNLAPVRVNDLFNLMLDVCEAENLDTPEEVLDLLASEADGSPRAALSNLAVCGACTTVAEAAEMLESASVSVVAYDLCKWLVSDRSRDWEQACAYVKGMEGIDPESIRLLVMAYFATVAVNSTGVKATRALTIMDAFSGGPYNRNEKMAPVLLALGVICFE